MRSATLPVPPPPLPSVYFRAVDGLRGVAVLSVLMYHTGLYENGLFGVDLFMVLSGYLITLTLLREESRRARIRLGSFYRRRAKRLLVPLLVTLGATAVATTLLGRPEEADRVLQQGLASLLQVANWEQIARGEAYWDAMGVPGPLAHMWSLSLTEQFYLVWPPLLALVCAVVTRGRRAVIAVIAAGLAIAMTTVTVLQYDGGNADLMYLGTHTHGVGLMVGSCAAFVTAASLRRQARGPVARRRLPRPLAGLVTVVLLGAIVVVSVGTDTYEAPWLYRWGGLTVVAVLSAALILALTREDTLVARAFASMPLVELGKASYSLYLVHVPVFWVLQRTVEVPGPATIALMGIPWSVVIALFLHHIVGEPVRLRRWNRAGGTSFAVLTAAVCAALVVSPTMVRQESGTGGVRVLVLGDSLGHDFATSLTTFAADDFSVTDAAFNGCGIFSPETSRTTAIEQGPAPGCLPWEDRWRDAVRESAPDVVLVNLAWDGAEQRVGGRWTEPCSPAYADRYRYQLASALEILTADGTQRQVLLASSRRFTPIATPENAACHTDLLRELAAEHPATVSMLELDEFVCTDRECRQETPDEAPTYIDTVHFTRAGMRWIAPWLATSVQEVTGAEPRPE
ncbi:acyltransferase family protein [Promicromonospora sp. MEB111]|uniref:acyltransferase family protein n=1 Tax=Promicromonospora sp. MEB111 TaxID=3040301 RepID=UPI002550E306|nr:acyltransferase family protein [Promicromonospora sp. MEB111]